MSQSKFTNVSRRTMFAASGAMGVLGVAAVANKLPQVTTPVAQATEKDSTKLGYQLTDHVRQYYATARL